MLCDEKTANEVASTFKQLNKEQRYEFYAMIPNKTITNYLETYPRPRLATAFMELCEKNYILLEDILNGLNNYLFQEGVKKVAKLFDRLNYLQRGIMYDKLHLNNDVRIKLETSVIYDKSFDYILSLANDNYIELEEFYTYLRDPKNVPISPSRKRKRNTTPTSSPTRKRARHESPIHGFSPARPIRTNKFVENVRRHPGNIRDPIKRREMEENAMKSFSIPPINKGNIRYYFPTTNLSTKKRK